MASTYLFPADDEQAPLSAVEGAPKALLHEERLKTFPGLSMRVVPGMNRGLFVDVDVPAGTVLAKEAGIVWEEELVAENASGDRVVRMWRHPVLSNRDAIAVAYQMAPFHAQRVPTSESNDAASKRPAWKVVDEAGNELSKPVSRFELLRATLAANSFAITSKTAFPPVAVEPAAASQSEQASAESNSNPAQMHLSASESLDALYTQCGVVGRALFPVLGLANHSCAANAKVYEIVSDSDDGSQATTADGIPVPPVYALEARKGIAAGTEITISYAPRSWPKAKRQSELQSTWGFSCACPRCSVPWDDTIVLRCKAAGCTGSGHSTHGYCYYGKWMCEDCGADVRTGDASDLALTADAFDLEADLLAQCSTSGDTSAASDVWQLSPLPAMAIYERLSQHPLLAPEDHRVFSALNRLMGLISDAIGGEAQQQLDCSEPAGPGH